MMTITGLSHLFKWENLHNWWLTKYFFAPLYNCDVRSQRNSLKYNVHHRGKNSTAESQEEK